MPAAFRHKKRAEPLWSFPESIPPAAGLQLPVNIKKRQQGITSLLAHPYKNYILLIFPRWGNKLTTISSIVYHTRYIVVNMTNSLRDWNGLRNRNFDELNDYSFDDDDEE